MSEGDTSRPHIVQVVLALGRGGLESMATQLAIALHRRGYHSSVIALDEGGEQEDALRDAGVPYHIFGGSFRSPAYHRRMIGLLRAVQPTVLHTHNLAPLLRIVLAGKVARVGRYVHTEHSTNYMDERSDYHRMLGWLSWFTDAFVLVGQQLTPFYTDRVRVPRKKLSVIPNGIDLDRFQPMRDRPRARQALGIGDGFIVGSAGRLAPEKNYGFLIRGIAQARLIDPRVRLALVGDGAERASLEQLAQELGVADAVSFLGWHRDVAHLLPAFDLFAISSLGEGLPLAVLEAMACGIPVISTPVGEMPSVLAGGRAGRLFDHGNDQDLGRLIAELATSNVAEQMGHAARALVEERYSSDRMVERYVALYLPRQTTALAS